jgi:ankyrin repeat protein
MKDKAPDAVKASIFRAALARATRSSGQERTKAINLVASCYSIGVGVHQNQRKANKWYKLGAELGDPQCMQAVIFFHVVQLMSKEYVKIRRPDICKYVFELLFLYTTNDGEQFLGKRLQKAEYLALRDAMCSSLPTSLWTLMYAYRNYVIMHKVVDQEKIATGIRQLGDDSLFKEAALAVQSDDHLRLNDAISRCPEVLKASSDGGHNLLHLAVIWDRGGLVIGLIDQHNLDPFLRDKSKMSPFELALHLGSQRAFQGIMFCTVRRGTNSKMEKINFLDLVHEHIITGDGRMTFKILVWSLSLKDNELFTNADIHQTMVNELTYTAIVNNNWHAFCGLIQFGANVEYASPRTQGLNLLCAATYYNQPLMVGVLLALGADPGGSGSLRFPNSPPMHIAAVGAGPVKEPELTKSSELHEFDYERISLLPTLCGLYPCHKADLQRMSMHLLLTYGAGIDQPEALGHSPLSFALATASDVMSSKWLVEHDPPADINATNFAGRTSLHLAVTSRDLQRLDFCLKWGADTEAKDMKGRTALSIASDLGIVRLCKRLLHSGANIAARDGNGVNCLQLAVHSRELTRFYLDILKQGTRETFERVLHSRDHQGRNIIDIIVAAPSNKRSVPIDVLKQLLDEGASPMTADNAGFSPMHWAAMLGHCPPEHLKLLLEYGQNMLLFFADGTFGWQPGHMAALYRNMSFLRICQEHNPLTVAFVSQEKGRVVPLSMMELIEKRKQITQRSCEVANKSSPDESSRTSFIRKLDSTVSRLINAQTPILASRFTEPAALERILKLRQMEIFPPAVPQLEYLTDETKDVRSPLPFCVRNAWILDSSGQHRGEKPLSAFSDNNLQSRVWVIDLDGRIHGVVGNPDGALLESEKESEGLTLDQQKMVGDMLRKVLEDTGIVGDGLNQFSFFDSLPTDEDGEWIYPEDEDDDSIINCSLDAEGLL